MQSPSLDNADTKAEFRKPSNDTANRKYRRRSPASSSDESPGRGNSSSPIHSREDPEKILEHRERRKNEDRFPDRDSGWSRYGRGDWYRHSDRHSTRPSHGQSRNDDYRRDVRRSDEDRHHHASYHSGRESRSSRHYGHAREGENCRSRDHMRDVGSYPSDRHDGSGHRSRDKEKESSSRQGGKKNDPDEKIDSDRIHGGHRSENAADGIHSSRKKDDHNRSGESWRTEPREMNEKERKYDEGEANHDKNRQRRASEKQNQDNSASGSENIESLSKQPKLFSSERKTGFGEEGLKQGQDNDGEANVGHVHAGSSDTTNDLQAAKVAAMKAAELVNKNLVGVGVMSAEQKKKLLWGTKKTTTSDESGSRWNTAMFGDRERQEKFNKLMGVKGEAKSEQGLGNTGGSSSLEAQKQEELQMDLEKQYTAGLRRRDGRTVGLGL